MPPPPMEPLLLIDAAKRARCCTSWRWSRILAMPARIVRTSPVAIGLPNWLPICWLCAARRHKVMTMDLHADQIQGFFNGWDHLYASTIFVPYIESLKPAKPYYGSTWYGGARPIPMSSESWHCDLVTAQRAKANVVESMTAIEKLQSLYWLMIWLIPAELFGGCWNDDDRRPSARAICTHWRAFGKAYETSRNQTYWIDYYRYLFSTTAKRKQNKILECGRFVCQSDNSVPVITNQ